MSSSRRAAPSGPSSCSLPTGYRRSSFIVSPPGPPWSAKHSSARGRLAHGLRCFSSSPDQGGLFMDRNVGTLERWISTLGGGALLAWGLGRDPRRSPLAGTLALGGAALLYRGTTGHCPIYGALG